VSGRDRGSRFVKRCLSIVLLAVLVLAAGCGPRRPATSMTTGEASIATSDAAFYLAWKLAGAFQDNNPQAVIKIRNVDNRSMVDSLLSERVEEIFLDRTLAPLESLAFREAKLKLHTYPIAYFPVFLLVPEGNTVGSVDSAELRGILSGTICNWRDVGGEDLPLMPYLPLPAEGAFQSLLRYFGSLDSVSARVCSTAAGMLEAAKDNPGALLVYSLPIENLRYRRLKFERGGYEIPANVKTIMEETPYPFRLDFTYVTTHAKDDVAAGYLTFCTSNTGQREAMRIGYRPAAVPVRIVRLR
jgi:phosphate transport system substrate-binding protein